MTHRYLKKEGFASKILLGGVDNLPVELLKQQKIINN
jgi:hypothetical protein